MTSSSREVLNKLIRITLGNEKNFSLPSVINWHEVINMSFQQGVVALAVDGLQKIYDERPGLELSLDTPEQEGIKYAWFGQTISIEEENLKINKRSAELSNLFATGGFRSCVLKGQGLALLYPNPTHRQSGDIDLWVEGTRSEIISFISSKCKISDPMVHHVDALFYPDTSVEVHYIPAWVFNPFSNRKLQVFFKNQSPEQFGNIITAGFACPTVLFNLVFCLVHMYRHTFAGNDSLKQYVDYYQLLVHSTEYDRKQAYQVIKSIGLASYAAYVMATMVDYFHVNYTFLLCAPSRKCIRPIKESLWIYPWKIWHLLWRRFAL